MGGNRVSPTPSLLEGKVALVTGGAAGLGAAIAGTLAGAGARGAVVDLVEPPAKAVPDGWAAITADVRDEASISRAFAQVGALAGIPDVVVANAGVVPRWTATEEIDPADWDAVFAVNTRGVMLTVREAVRVMRRRRAGSIVVMSSLNGWKGDPHIASYVASKHAVVGLVRSVALDVGRDNIRVNAVGPGPVPTDALRARMASRASRGEPPVEEALRLAGAATALGRVVTPEEVASAALFLASDLASGVTGQLIAVDAGVL
ncbi:MAG: SDR family oxidoreductase [Actinomycetota bacterium]|nr:SDR family oxidoreductase [Actinomycetota bacterium]